MPSEQDLLSQWAGEELFAAGRADDGLQNIHRARGHFYRDVLRELREHPGHPADAERLNDHPVAHLLAVAFGQSSEPPFRTR